MFGVLTSSVAGTGGGGTPRRDQPPGQSNADGTSTTGYRTARRSAPLVSSARNVSPEQRHLPAQALGAE